VTDALLNIITNARLKLLFKLNIITKKIYNQLTTINLAFNNEKNTVYDIQMQDKNQFSSRIWLFFNYHEIVSMYILYAAYNSLTMNENEHRNTKCSFKNTSFYWLYYNSSLHLFFV